jgi:hypothetical protein
MSNRKAVVSIEVDVDIDNIRCGTNCEFLTYAGACIVYNYEGELLNEHEDAGYIRHSECLRTEANAKPSSSS